MSEKEQFEQINRQMRELLLKVDNTMLRVEAVYGKIVGTELHPIGLIDEVKELKTEVEKQKDFIKAVKWSTRGMLAMVAYGGFKGIQFIIKWLSDLA